MIAGTGIDLIDVRRVAGSLLRNGDRLARRILHADEWTVYIDRGGAASARAQRFVASRFAAKEAFAKAWGTGIGAAVGFHSISVLNNAAGAPVLQCHADELKAAFLQRGMTAWVSLSDEGDFVIAQVILEAQR